MTTEELLRVLHLKEKPVLGRPLGLYGELESGESKWNPGSNDSLREEEPS